MFKLKDIKVNDIQSLSHTTWNCKYHIVFAPKYRRKVFFGQKRKEIGAILRSLCEWKQVEIIEAELSSMTGPQNSEDTVNNSASYNITIPQKEQSVNSSISENSENDTNKLRRCVKA